jgi:hypothetical protein
VRREDLRAVDQPVAAVLRCRGAQLRHRRARVRLGHAERHDLAALEQVGQEARLLLGARVLDEGADRAEVARLHDIGAAGQASATSWIAITASMSVPPAPPSALAEGDAHEALRGDLLRRLPRVLALVGALQRAGRELLLREAAHRFGEGALLSGEAGSPRAVSSFQSCASSSRLRARRSPAHELDELGVDLASVSGASGSPLRYGAKCSTRRPSRVVIGHVGRALAGKVRGDGRILAHVHLAHQRAIAGSDMRASSNASSAPSRASTHGR